MNIERLAKLASDFGVFLALVVTTVVAVFLMGRLAEDYPWLLIVAVLVIIIWPALRKLWDAMMRWNERRPQQISQGPGKN